MEAEIPADLLESNKPYLNPLIGRLQGDTLINCHDALIFLRQAVHYEETLLIDGAAMGYYFLSQCVTDALMFEIECRKKLDGSEADDEPEEESDDTTNVEAIHET